MALLSGFWTTARLFKKNVNFGTCDEFQFPRATILLRLDTSCPPNETKIFHQETVNWSGGVFEHGALKPPSLLQGKLRLVRVWNQC